MATLLESLEKLGVHSHIGLLYRNPKESLDVLAPYLRTGLARGEKCLLYVAPQRGEEILGALSGAGIDIGSALARGAIIASRLGRGNASLDPDEIVAFLRDAARQARSEKYSALRLCIDVPFVLKTERTPDRINEFQAKLHEFVTEQDSLSLCVHGLDELSPEILMGALRSHPQVIFDGRLLDNFFFVPPSIDPEETTPRRKLEKRLAHLVEHNDRIARIRRQAIRLERLREVTSSLLAREEMPDILNSIVVGVISLGHRMCWIGMANPDGSVVPAAEWGDKKGYLRKITVRWDETPLGQGPVGRAIREGKPSIVQDVLRSRRFAPWRESALEQGFQSVAAFPLGEGTPAAGALAVYASGTDAFGKEAVEELTAYAQMASLVLARARELQSVAESGERFRSVVENTDIFVAELDARGNILLFNRAAEKITGYDSAEVLGQAYVPLFIPERERERVAAIYRDILGGKAANEFVNAIRTKDGGERTLSWHTKAFFGAGGEIRGIVGMGVDVTDRLRMEKEREILRNNLANARKMEAVGALAGGIAHDFNNILGAIIGYASLMQTRMDPASPFLDAARKIQDQAMRAADLTAKLLGFAQLDKHKVDPVSLNDVAASVVGVVSTSFDRSIEIRTRLEPSLPAIAGDAGQLEQLLLDLCLNARDAMPSGGTLTIETGAARLSGSGGEEHHARGAGDHAIVTVRDTGEGMTDEVRQRLFEPLYTTRQELGRTGMGLAMVYGIVKRHQGKIEVESAPGAGSTFRIYLPAAAPREVAKAERPAAPIPRGAGTILVVDDEPGIREMAGDLLSMLGYTTLLAEDGAAACRVFREREGRIDLVLLDIIMPNMGGKETFETLRALSPSLPILLSSGYTVQGRAQEILDKGANGFLQKPYCLADLARAVRGILDSRLAG